MLSRALKGWQSIIHVETILGESFLHLSADSPFEIDLCFSFRSNINMLSILALGRDQYNGTVRRPRLRLSVYCQSSQRTEGTSGSST